MAPAPTAPIPAEQRIRLCCIDWAGYIAYSDGLGPQHVRCTYDDGEMELMTVSWLHEFGKKRLARMIEALTEVLGIDIASGGSLTCRQEELKQALEPDECYWIEHEEAVRDLTEIDFTRDPPPDLAIEVEISRSTMDRISLYASLGVPELWRWDGKRLTFGVLGPDGQYHESERSLAFPFLPVAEFVRFLTMRGPSETQIINQFRQWVREQQAAGWPEKKTKKNGGNGTSRGRNKSK